LYQKKHMTKQNICLYLQQIMRIVGKCQVYLENTECGFALHKHDIPISESMLKKNLCLCHEMYIIYNRLTHKFFQHEKDFTFCSRSVYSSRF